MQRPYGASRWLVLFSILCALCVTSDGWAQKSSSEVRKALRKVDRQIMSYSPEKARRDLEPVMNEKDPMVDAAMGQILVLEQKYDEAVSKLQAASKATGDPMLLIALGDAQAYVKNKSQAGSAYQDAQKEAEKLVQKKPSDADALLALGTAQQRQKDYGEAERNLSKAALADESNPRIPFELGMTQMLQNNNQAAVDSLTKAIDLYSGYAYAYYYRALAANQIGRKDMTVNDLDRFLALAPNAPEAAKAQRILQSARG